MGSVYAEITLKNAGDIARQGLAGEGEVRSATVRALVDTGAMSLVIGEELREELGLEVKRYRRVSYANSAGELCKVTEPVEIHWKDRETALPALVVPGVRRVLMGVIPLEDLDLVVDPNKQELVGAHGDEAVYMV